jgi:hypothetical protein
VICAGVVVFVVLVDDVFADVTLLVDGDVAVDVWGAA